MGNEPPALATKGDEGATAGAGDAEDTPEKKIAALEEKLKERSAPEGDYEDVALGDGYAWTDELKADTTAWAKEQGFSQAQLNAIVAKFQEHDKKNLATWTEQTKAWKAANKADKEFGGDKYAENVAIMLKARDMFGYDKEFDTLLSTAGIGDSPPLLRFLYRLGKHQGFGSKTAQSEGATGSMTLGDAFYGPGAMGSK